MLVLWLQSFVMVLADNTQESNTFLPERLSRTLQMSDGSWTLRGSNIPNEGNALRG
jgi:hypothetical protein